jgi:hypothetical protein
LEALQERFSEEVRRRETAEANARELLAIYRAQCDAIESHNMAVTDVHNKASFCYRAVKGALTSEQKKKVFEAQSDDSDDDAPLVTKKLPAVPLCTFVDYDYALVASNPHKTDVNNVDAKSVSDKSKSSRKSILSKYGA